MTPSPSAAYSWLLTHTTPIDPALNGLGWSAGEARLWWGVVHQAAYDVLTLPESEALDAAEWLKDSGAYLVESLFGVPVETTRKALAHLIKNSRTLGEKAKGYGF